MQRKLFLSYVAIIVMLVTITLVSVFTMVRHMVTDNLVSSADQAMTRWSSELSSVMDYGKSYILNLSINDQFQTMLREAVKDDSGVVETENFSELTGTSLVDGANFLYANSVVLSHIPYMLEVCYNDGESFVPLYSSSRQNVTLPAPYSYDSPWVSQLLSQNGRFLWSLSSDNANDYIRLSKMVYDTQDWNTILGAVSVEFSYQHIALGILNRLKNQSGIEAFIINKKTGEAVGYDSYKPMTQLAEYLPPNDLSGGFSKNRHSYLMSYPINNSDYYLVGVKSLKEVDQLFFRSCTVLLVTATLTVIVAMILASFFSRSISKPIRELSYTMKGVQNGDLDVTVTTDYTGDIGELYSSFNHMIQMINSLIEDNYVTRLNQKQSDLNALQAQINTHFLYNTLDSINWMAMDHDVPDISRLVTNLSVLLRTSLNNGSQELTVRRELEHVRCYIDIQNIRFDNLFQAEWQVDSEVLDDIIIKVLLQPLVENAINHGFKRPETGEKKNRLIIRAIHEATFLTLQVKNNGTEIDLHKVEELLLDTPGFVPKSYGIQSIRTRLKVYYNDEAEYCYSMDDDGMITATIRIPLTYTRPGGCAAAQ